MATLCNPNGTFLTQFLRGIDPLSIPDLALLESQLRKHKVSGLVMLSELTHPMLRDEFGIMAMGERSVLMHMIRDLRRRSDKYIEFLKLNRIYEIRDRRSESMSSSIPSPSRIHFEPPTSENAPTSVIPLGQTPQSGDPLSTETFSKPDQQPETLNQISTSLMYGDESTLPDRQTVQPETASDKEIQMADIRISTATNQPAEGLNKIPTSLMLTDESVSPDRQIVLPLTTSEQEIGVVDVGISAATNAITSTRGKSCY